MKEKIAIRRISFKTIEDMRVEASAQVVRHIKSTCGENLISNKERVESTV